MAQNTLLKIIAHRGFSWSYPEQTEAAYKAAIAAGADALECDVHLTKDGELVCIHDADLKRVAGINKKVSDVTLEELKELDVSKDKDGFRGEPDSELDFTDDQLTTIITLEELIDIIKDADREVGLVIETKKSLSDGLELEEKVVEVLEKKGMAKGKDVDDRVQFMSFFMTSVKFFHENFPQASVTQLIDDSPLKDFPAEFEITEEKKDHFMRRAEASAVMVRRVGFGLKYLKTYLKQINEWADEGIQLRCFTVNTDEEFKALDKGVGIENLEYIITDRPDYMRKKINAN